MESILPQSSFHHLTEETEVVHVTCSLYSKKENYPRITRGDGPQDLTWKSKAGRTDQKDEKNEVGHTG